MQVMTGPKISAGEHRRKREAMDALVIDVVRGTDDNVASCLRIALEVTISNKKQKKYICYMM